MAQVRRFRQGSKLLAARKAGTGVDTTFDEAALADELHGKVG